jgi:exopolysaccharide biosynthesis protein
MAMRFLTLIFLIISELGASAKAQIDVRPFEKEIDHAMVRGYIATLDLTDPRLSPCVTHAINPKLSPNVSADVNAHLVTTDQWASDNHLSLAINANYFGWKPGGGKIIGLLVDDGKTVSPPRTWNGQTDPALVFCRQGPVWCAHVIGPGQPLVGSAEIQFAVAGVGGSDSDPKSGTLLVQGGKNLGSTARVYHDKRLARTAAGLDRSGRKLTIIAIDGKQPGWSAGVTLPQLADLMIDQGVFDAVNFDGGGSTSFVYQSKPDGKWITNRPCDEFGNGHPGQFRAVAVQLGFGLSQVPASPAQSETIVK